MLGMSGHAAVYVLTFVSNASKLVPLQGVVVLFSREKHCAVTGG